MQEVTNKEVGTDNSPSEEPAAPASKQKQPANRKKLGLIALAVIIVVGAAIAILVATRHKSAAPTARTFHIGLLAPSGDTLSTGIAMKQGMEVAQAKYKSDNFKIDVVQKDTNCDADSAKKAMQELADRHDIVAVIGEACSGATLAAAPIANKYQIPLVSPASTSPDLTTAGDYVFRTIPSDALTGKFTANLLYNTRHIKRLAIVYSNEDYGIGLSAAVKQNFEALGGTVVAYETYEDGSTDVAKQTQAMKAANPDAIYMAPSAFTSPVAILQQMKALSFSVPVYGSEVLGDQNFIKDAADLAEGITVVTVSQGNADFAAQHRAMFQEDPELYGAQSNDAYIAIFKAVQAGATTGPAIKDKIAHESFAGASGQITFDKNGDVPANYVVYQVQDGKLRAPSS